MWWDQQWWGWMRGWSLKAKAGKGQTVRAVKNLLWYAKKFGLFSPRQCEPSKAYKWLMTRADGCYKTAKTWDCDLHFFRNAFLIMQGVTIQQVITDFRKWRTRHGKENRNSPSMTTGRVDCALLAANHEVIDVSRWESHSSNGHRLGLIVHQLHALLPKHGVVTFPLSTPRHAKDSMEKSFD